MMGVNKLFYKGFKFGMLLQFAIGPVCVFIFQMASLNGFFVAETGVMGVVLIDGLYILAAILGIAAVIERKNIRIVLKIFGAFVLFIFGISMCLNMFNIKFIPSLNISYTPNLNSSFLHAVFLTASNPLTIFFWAGVFSTKIVEESFKKVDIYIFGLGSVLSTMFFLTLIAFLGSLTNRFISPTVINYMNLVVGIMIVYFSIKMIVKK
jgi:threonine/homoserine/homoserine lactone efflux protein